MRSLFLVLILSTSPLYFSNCAASRQANQLAMHYKNLEKAAMGNLDPEAKMDIMMSSFVGMMDESLRILNPKKGVQYVQKYGQQNSGNIEIILNDLGDWQKSLNLVQKLALGVRLAQKPYLKDMIELGPKFKNKYEQIKFMMDLTGKVKKGLFDLGVEQLGAF